ncbi:hypothetical protein CVT25_015445 [Psilocybe cyanescens]|uniref:F-box domain-containing protein n=1 Tax=Psilocybe cyanescens TaxID=93625 RepID=A0A409WHG0_PSICY|nr:hypothetical protein CVT25_015445 [Psilocybe cyanescens]
MKILRFYWQRRLRKQEDLCSALPSPILPILPTEIWHKIIAFVVRLAGATSIGLDDPFATPHMYEEYPDIDPALFEDRKAVSLVCSGWNEVVTEISSQYLVIYSGKQLKNLVKKFESSKNPQGRRLGDWTTRIDFKILGQYKIEHVVRLLRCTPNLVIYNNGNGTPSIPEKCTPREVIDALVANCSQFLQRVEWSGAGESPRYRDLVKLCNGLPNLTTLRLLAIHSYPLRHDGIPPRLHLPKLNTLSLGVIPDPIGRSAEFLLTWDLFLQYISSSPFQLPALERFECDIFPLQTMSFFSKHGQKIRLFRTTAWSAEKPLPEALSLCPNLQSLVISQGSETRISLPVFHPALQRICILPSVEVEIGVPQRVYDSAVMTPLDTLLKSFERMVAPNLVEMRIRNTGAYGSIIEYSTWLHFWWIRWNIRGVQFCDKAGTSWKYVHDPGEALLDSIRC